MPYSLLNILYDAQDGDAVGNFARQFGLSFDNTERVMEALMPAFSRGFKRNTATPLSLASFLDVLGQERHVRYWADPLAAFEPKALVDGSGILGHIFGPEGLVYAIAKEVSRRTGVPRDTVQAMMPPIAATLVGGIAEELPHTSFGDLIDALNVKDPVFETALQLEEMALNDDYFKEKKLFPNVDFYSGIILNSIGFPTTMFTALFALARTVGWVAQWNEMISDPAQVIGRPRQLYTGPTERDYVPVGQR